MRLGLRPAPPLAGSSAPGDGAAGADLDRVPCGPAVGAFFDFDGTVIDGFSAGVFEWDRLRRRQVAPAELGRMLLLVPGLVTGRADMGEVILAALAGWRGFDQDELAALGDRLFADVIAGRIYPEARARIQAHAERGHTVVLASSATRFQVAAFARDLGIDHVLCTDVEVDETGRVTGGVRGPLVRGRAKADAARQFARSHGVHLASSFAYADGEEDEPFLAAVGHPRPVNPAPGLARLADERGWPVRRYAPRRGLAPDRSLRTGAAYGAMLLAGGVGAAVGLLNRSRRQGVNTLTSLAPDLALALAGVTLRVQGEEHLWLRRPAVFVANHQSPADVLVLSGLLRRDFTAVAKSELALHPVLGPLGRFTGVVFLDRGNSEKAIGQLNDAVQTLRQGISVLVLPEGTRSATPRPGPFKKGAFHLAMAAGVPVVPIVVRNSGDVMWRNARTLRPGVVDVVVHPPIGTEHWRAADLDEHVRAVRQLYLDTLGVREP